MISAVRGQDLSLLEREQPAWNASSLMLLILMPAAAKHYLRGAPQQRRLPWTSGLPPGNSTLTSSSAWSALTASQPSGEIPCPPPPPSFLLFSSQ